MNDRMKPALIGGLIVGLLSAIPFVNIVNACCCAWAIIGGVVATYPYVKNSANPVTPGEGATLGAMAGGIGAVVYVIVGVPLALVLGNTMATAISSLVAQSDPAQAEAIRQQVAASTGFGAVLLNSIIVAVLLVIFSVIGGLLGVPIFEKRKGGAGTPPAPGFGPGPGGGGQPGGGPYGGGYGS